MRVGCEQRVGLRLGFVGIAAEMISVSARIMARHAMIALGIFGHGALGVDIAHELGLDPLEARLERRIGRLVVGRVCSQRLAERRDSLRVQRVVAVEAVLGVDRKAIFLVLQLAEKFEDALAADTRPSTANGGGRVGGRLLAAGEGHEFAFRGLLAGRHDAHRRRRRRRPRSRRRRAPATGSDSAAC